MVSPSQRRHAARSVVAAGTCSRRQACRYLGLARASFAYRGRPPTERQEQVRAGVVRLSQRHPRYGYRRVHALLLREGLTCARRTVQRLRRQEGLRVRGPARRPKCPPRPDAKLKAEGVNDVWCLDLVFDTTARGGTVKFLTIVDEGAHYCVDIAAGRRLGAREVVAALQAAIARLGAPRHLRSDNGGEFIARALQDWLREAGVKPRFIEPGSPWQNGVIESFNARFRDECLDRELLGSVLEAQVLARQFRDEYNQIRPHSSLEYATPDEFRAKISPQAPGSGTARQAGPSLRPELAVASTPVHPTHDHQPNTPTLSPGGPER
ncbi:MAG: IS3 family transposase [Bryobacteraceae bacterium]|nr:IS3 family transposase [Bryobacteraceae bacterium]